MTDVPVFAGSPDSLANTYITDISLCFLYSKYMFYIYRGLNLHMDSCFSAAAAAFSAVTDVLSTATAVLSAASAVLSAARLRAVAREHRPQRVESDCPGDFVVTILLCKSK